MRFNLICDLSWYDFEHQCWPLLVSDEVAYGFAKFCQRFTNEAGITTESWSEITNQLKASTEPIMFRKQSLRGNGHVFESLVSPAAIKLLLSLAGEEKPPLFTDFYKWTLQQQEFLTTAQGIWLRVVCTRKN